MCVVVFCYIMFVVLIFGSAADICDLKIIKDVADAKSVVTAAAQQSSKKACNTQTVANARQNDRHISPKAEDDSIVLFQHSVSGVLPTSTTESRKGTNVSFDVKSASAASPKKTLVKATPRSLNCKKSQNVVAMDSRSSPFKKQINGCFQNKQINGMSRVKGYDAGRVGGCSPNDLSTSVQTMTVSDEMVKTAERNQRKRTTSGMASVKNVPLNFSQKLAVSSAHSPAHLNSS